MFSNELSILALYGLLVVLVLVAQSAVSIPQLDRKSTRLNSSHYS